MARRRMSDVEAAVAAEREEARLLAKLQPSTISSEQGRQYVRCFASMAPKIGRGAAHSSCLAAAMDEPARYAVMSERGRVVAHSGTLEGAHRASRRARHVGSSVNRADGGEPAPYQVILQQLGGQGRLRAMLGASFSQADGGRTLEMKFPNRLRSRPNFIRIRYEPGPDTYVVEFWRVDRSGPGKKLRELDDVYADSLKEIIERETGLYLNLAGSANRAGKRRRGEEQFTPGVRRVMLSRGEIEVKGSGYATYWRSLDPGDRSPWAGRFVLASPGFRAEIEEAESGAANRVGVTSTMDSMTEVLLTVLAISQSGYAGPLSHAIPSRLQSALRRAREAGFVYVDDAGPYLEDEGAVELQRRGFGGSVFSNNRGGESRIMGGFEGDLARAEIAKLQGYETGASGEPIDQEIARLRAAVRANV